MNFCEQALLRLKNQLRVATDKEVAELLGLGEKALNARKKRDSFPEDKLFAFAAKHPELQIDTAYVLTGTPAAAHAAMANIRSAADVATRLGGGGERLAAVHAAITAQQVTLDAVHQAVLDAVDLLSLEGKVDAQQLAKAVVKLCQRTTQSPNAGGMIQSNVIKGDRVEMKVGINHGQVVEGNVTNHGAMNIGQGKGSGSKT